MNENNTQTPIRRLLERLPSDNSAVLVTSPVSLRYLSGLNIDSGIILASKEVRILFVKQSELALFKNKCADFDVTALTDKWQMLDVLIKYGIKRVFIEADKMTVSEYSVFKERLHYAKIDTTNALDNAILDLRTVKTEAELSAVANAQKICDKAYDRLLGSIRKGMSERQIASMLGYYLIKFGSDGENIPITVLSGENTANPYLRPSDRQITEGDMLILGFGASWGGYNAKMFRTCAVGKIDPKRENAYNAVECAIEDGLGALRAGVGNNVADSVARATLNAWGVDQYCFTTFAHGIGLEPEEPPYLGRGGSVALRAGTALFTKCGVIVPGRYGIKIGDMAVLTDIGCNNLTKATKMLVHI